MQSEIRKERKVEKKNNLKKRRKIIKIREKDNEDTGKYEKIVMIQFFFFYVACPLMNFDHGSPQPLSFVALSKNLFCYLA